MCQWRPTCARNEQVLPARLPLVYEQTGSSCRLISIEATTTARLAEGVILEDALEFLLDHLLWHRADQFAHLFTALEDLHRGN